MSQNSSASVSSWIGRRELRRQGSAQPADLSLNLGAGVVGHQAHDLVVNLELTQVTRSIQRMESCIDSLRGVADVM